MRPKRPGPKAWLYLLALAFAAPGVRADPVYVIEQLVVSVGSAPDGESERIGQVKSGDKLELIERQGDEAHVRLSNGKDGWIKGSYLTTEPPVQARLTERTAEVEKLKQEGDKLKQDVSRLESELAAARAAPKETPPPTTDSAGPPAPIHETVFLRSPERTGPTSWQFLLGVAAVMLLVGFVIGWKTLDRRIRQKYGGLRIY
jgi:Bacterial SH3 domain